MRLLQLTPVYHPALSGSAVLFQELSEGLVGSGTRSDGGHQQRARLQRLLGTRHPRQQLAGRRNDRRCVGETAAVRRRHSCANYWRLVRHTWKYRLPGSDWLRTWYDGPVLDFSAMRGEISNAAPRAYDVVCAGHTPSMMVVYGRRISKRLEAPYVVIPGLHADNTFNTERRNITRILRAADHLCANTTFEREALLKLTGARSDRVTVTGCGVDPSSFATADGQHFRREMGIPEDAPTVLFVGAEAPHKGLLVLLEAMEAVRYRMPDAYLVIAGVRSSASEEIDRRLARDPKMAARTVRVNSFAEERKADIYDSCDLFAMPSWSESFGIVYLEAWARSKPVIGCGGGAVETVISDGEDGVLVKPGDAQALAGAIRSLLWDPDRRRGLGESGRRKVESRFTWERVTGRFEQA